MVLWFRKELDKGQFLFICLGFDFTLFRIAIAKDNLNSSSKFESSLLHRLSHDFGKYTIK